MANLLVELANIGQAVTISDFQKKSEYASMFSNQKISALFRNMIKSGEVEKTVEKGKSYFSVV